MKLATSIHSLTAGILISATGMNVAVAQRNGVEADARIAALELQVQQLQTKNQNLSKVIVHAKDQQSKATGELNKIRLELEALSMYPLGSDDQRLVQALANRKVLEGKLAHLETEATKLTAQVREYLNHAIATDVQQRVKLESSIRSLDVALGIRDKPQPQIDQGTLQQAKIISIDTNSGAIILNTGEKQQVRIGMTFRILRGKSQIAEARIAEVRPEIAGALIIRLDDTNNAVRPGDIAQIKTQN